MLVPKGNPKNINNYADVISTGAKLVTGAVSTQLRLLRNMVFQKVK